MFSKEEKGLMNAYEKVGKQQEDTTEKKTLFEKQRNDKQSMLDAIKKVKENNSDFEIATGNNK